MRLLKDPKTPLWIRLVSWAVAIIVALLIVRLVFTFGYYASGLAVLDAQKKQREKTPIKLEFPESGTGTPVDPNAADPNQATGSGGD